MNSKIIFDLLDNSKTSNIPVRVWIHTATAIAIVIVHVTAINSCAGINYNEGRLKKKIILLRDQKNVFTAYNGIKGIVLRKYLD